MTTTHSRSTERQASTANGLLMLLLGLFLLIAGPLIPLFMALVGMAAEAASRDQMAEIGALNRLAASVIS